MSASAGDRRGRLIKSNGSSRRAWRPAHPLRRVQRQGAARSGATTGPAGGTQLCALCRSLENASNKGRGARAPQSGKERRGRLASSPTARSDAKAANGFHAPASQTMRIEQHIATRNKVSERTPNRPSLRVGRESLAINCRGPVRRYVRSRIPHPLESNLTLHHAYCGRR